MSTPSLRRRLSEVLNPHQKMRGTGFVVDLILSILIVSNVIAFALQSVGEINAVYAGFFRIFEAVSVIIFTVEYLGRLWTAPERIDLPGSTAAAKRLRYVFSLMGLIDLMVIIPFWLRWLVPLVDLRWLRILRLFWLFKMSHFTPALELIAKAAYEERKALLSTLYLLLIVIMMSGSLVYFAERNAQPEAFHSIPVSLYWSVMTLTPGNGDAVPVTLLGRIVGIFTAFTGVCTFALLTGILSTSFYNQLQHRQKILNIKIQDYLKDGIISRDEMAKIESLRKELNLSDQHTNEIVQVLTETHSNDKVKL